MRILMLKAALHVDDIEQEVERRSREKEVEAKEKAQKNMAQSEFCTMMQNSPGSSLLNQLRIMPTQKKLTSFSIVWGGSFSIFQFLTFTKF